MKELFVHFWWWFQHMSGTDNTAGRPYGFWSGFGSDLGEITLIGAIAGAYHKHNCHQKGCPRIGKHLYEGTPYCTKHHPRGDK